VGQSPAGKNESRAAEDGIRHQATTDQDTADWEELARALVNCKTYKLAIAL
jgi:hypothetical protein